MSKLILTRKFRAQLCDLNNEITALNTTKIKLLLKAIGITPSAKDFENMLSWELIIVTTPDKQMAVQLNKLSAYIPNLKFVADLTAEAFTVLQGKKARRVWKER